MTSLLLRNMERNKNKFIDNHKTRTKCYCIPAKCKSVLPMMHNGDSLHFLIIQSSFCIIFPKISIVQSKGTRRQGQCLSSSSNTCFGVLLITVKKKSLKDQPYDIPIVILKAAKSSVSKEAQDQPSLANCQSVGLSSL